MTAGHMAPIIWEPKIREGKRSKSVVAMTNVTLSGPGEEFATSFIIS